MWSRRANILSEGNVVANNGTFNNGTFNGQITSSQGSIGGWTLNQEGFTNGSVVIKNNGITTTYTCADLLVMQRIASGQWSPSSSIIAHYDFNGNGQVDAQDILHLTRLLGFN